MKTVYKIITNVIGKGKLVRGGRDWPCIYPLTPTGEYKFSQDELKEIIELLRLKFDCWELIQNFGDGEYINYIFIIKNEVGEYMGFCRINAISDDPIEITYGDNYLYPSETELHTSFNDRYTVSYKKI